MFSLHKNNRFLKIFFNFFPLLMIFAIVLWLYINEDINDILQIIKKFHIFDFILLMFLILLRPLFDTLRWYMIVRFFCSLSYAALFRATITGYMLNLVGNTTFGTEIAKLEIVRRDIGLKNSLTLLLIEKLISLALKIILITITSMFFIDFYEINFDLFFKSNYVYFSIFLILILLFILFYFKEQILKKIDLTNIINCLNTLKLNIIVILIFIFTSQLYNICVYITIIYFMAENIDILSFFLFVPLIETIAQIGVIIPGAQEFSTLFIFGNSSFGLEIALILAAIIKIGEFVSVIIHNLFIQLFFNR